MTAPRTAKTLMLDAYKTYHALRAEKPYKHNGEPDPERLPQDCALVRYLVADPRIASLLDAATVPDHMPHAKDEDEPEDEYALDVMMCACELVQERLQAPVLDDEDNAYRDTVSDRDALSVLWWALMTLHGAHDEMLHALGGQMYFMKKLAAEMNEIKIPF
jgi:hypothetical protein